ncbi:uncharacterized protein F4807DRAFT_460417 [Annulohypoxylon truncatum]|uniref:uncharacterized protein n=1 Tax=Annulohypoxylon truncatum TaxID=327061 RepID=UPI0020088B7C|nr:uncharacterized protein F4807DRAFT_460417 [Annulohypoxylon truncatum]KAI1209670.1 hypothetical protein F4807DRAFT_460417 [Annulohypoxylon truncatum]
MRSRRQSFSTIGREAGPSRGPVDIRGWVNSTDSSVSASATRSTASSRAPTNASSVHPHSSVSGSHRGSTSRSSSATRPQAVPWMAHRAQSRPPAISMLQYPPTVPVSDYSGLTSSASRARTLASAPSSARSSSTVRAPTRPPSVSGSGRSSSVASPVQHSAASSNAAHLALVRRSLATSGPQDPATSNAVHRDMVRRSQYPPLSASSAYTHSSASRTAVPASRPGSAQRSHVSGSHHPSSASSHSQRRASVSGTSAASGASRASGSRTSHTPGQRVGWAHGTGTADDPYYLPRGQATAGNGTVSSPWRVVSSRGPVPGPNGQPVHMDAEIYMRESVTWRY